jgi:hypothetical protein
MLTVRERFRRRRVGPSRDEIVLTRPAVDAGEPGVSPGGEPSPERARARAAQGDVTLGLEQGELEADFGHSALARVETYTSPSQRYVRGSLWCLVRHVRVNGT